MSSVILLDIPQEVTKADLVEHFSKPVYGGGAIDFLLYPFQPGKALAGFKDPRVIDTIFTHQHVVRNARLQVRPVPQQAYGSITAEIHPQIISQISNKTDFFIELNEEYGVKVRDAGTTPCLVGSWLQLQAAQSKIWEIYQRQQQQGWAQFMNDFAVSPVQSLPPFAAKPVENDMAVPQPASKPHGYSQSSAVLSNLQDGVQTVSNETKMFHIKQQVIESSIDKHADGARTFQEKGHSVINDATQNHSTGNQQHLSNKVDNSVQSFLYSSLNAGNRMSGDLSCNNGQTFASTTVTKNEPTQKNISTNDNSDMPDFPPPPLPNGANNENMDDWPAPPSFEKDQTDSKTDSPSLMSRETPPKQQTIEAASVETPAAKITSHFTQRRANIDFVTPKPFSISKGPATSKFVGVGLANDVSAPHTGNTLFESEFAPIQPAEVEVRTPKSPAEFYIRPQIKKFTVQSETITTKTETAEILSKRDNALPSSSVFIATQDEFSSVKTSIPSPRIELTTKERTAEPPKHLVISPGQDSHIKLIPKSGTFTSPGNNAVDSFAGSAEKQWADYEFDVRPKSRNKSVTSTPVTTPDRQKVKIHVSLTQRGYKPKSDLSLSQSNSSLEDGSGLFDLSVRPKTGSSSQFITLAEVHHRDRLRDSFDDTKSFSSVSSNESDCRPRNNYGFEDVGFYVNKQVAGTSLQDYAPASKPRTTSNRFSSDFSELPPPTMPPRPIESIIPTPTKDKFEELISSTPHRDRNKDPITTTVAHSSGTFESEFDPLVTSSESFKDNALDNAVAAGSGGIDNYQSTEEDLPEGDSLELETDIVSYLQEIKGGHIQSIQRKFDVRFTSENCGEFSSLHVLPQSGCTAIKIALAKDVFVSLYQDVFSKIWKEKITLQQKHITDLSVILNIIQEIRTKYDQVLVALDEENFKELTLIGDEKVIRNVKCEVLMKIMEASNKALQGKFQDKAKESATSKTAPLATTDPADYDIADDLSVDDQSKFSCKLDNIRILIYQADISKKATDVIVNAAQNDLAPSTGVAAAISGMAGSQFQDQCNRYVVKHGSLEDGDVMFMKSQGKLKCNFVINAVGPMWGLYNNKEECESLLMKTFLKCLKCANETLQAQSIALPAISTGMFGVPIDVCSRAIYSSIREFIRDRKPGDPLKEVHLVNINADVSGMIRIIFQQLMEVDYPGKTFSQPENVADLGAEASSYLPTSQESDGYESRKSHKPTDLDQFAEFANFRAQNISGNDEVLGPAQIKRSQSLHNNRSNYQRQRSDSLHENRNSVSSETSYLQRSLSYESQSSLNSSRHNEALVVSLPPSMYGSSEFDEVGTRYGNRTQVSLVGDPKDDLGSPFGDRTLVTVDIEEDEGTGDVTQNLQQAVVANKDMQNIQDVPVARSDSYEMVGQYEKLDKKEKKKSGSGKKSFGLSSLRSSFKRKKSKDKIKRSIIEDVEDESIGTTDSCAICFEEMRNPKTLETCGHSFCSRCIDDYFERGQPSCPSCGLVYGMMKGDQPKGGKVKKEIDRRLKIPGHENDSEGAIIVTYEIPSGFQKSCHPNPGQQYDGIFRTAYLPNNKDGRDVAKLFEKAFNAGLIFTIGWSPEVDRDGIIWGDITHKITVHGGPARNAYPDITYLQKVKAELAAKGIQ